MTEKLGPRRTGHEAATHVPVRDQKITLPPDSLASGISEANEEGEYAYIEGVMHNVFRDLMRNPEREKKYRDFLSGVFKLDKLWRRARLPNPENRFRAFILIYAQQRLFDDIIDGDTPIKLEPKDRVAYAGEKISNLETGSLHEDDMIEAFAVKILADIEVLDPAYVEKAKERLGLIMRSIAFDGRRILEREQTGELQILPQEELKRHFFDLDIEGTIGLTLFLFALADSEKNMSLLRPLGEATRIAYNLKDFMEDMRAGLCNIPKEDAERLSISQGDLEAVVKAEDISKVPQNVKTWLREQIMRGEELLKEHRELPISSLDTLEAPKGIPQKTINLLYKEVIKRRVLEVAYVSDAKKVFSSLLVLLDKQA